MSAPETLLDVRQVAAHLGLSRTKLHQLVRAGEVKVVRFGRVMRFRASEVQSFIERSEVRAEPPETPGGRR